MPRIIAEFPPIIVGPPGPAGEAPLDSPHFTGVPTAPTAARGTSTSQLATTAFVSASSSGPDSPYYATARQWQTALSLQAKLDAVRDALPADPNSAVAIQWGTAGVVRPPPTSDPVWTFTKTTLAYSDAQMTTLYALAQAQVA